MGRLWEPGRAPAAAVLLAWVAGALLHDRLPVETGVWIASAVAAAVVAIALRHVTVVASPLLIVAVILTGLARAQLDHFRFAGDEISLFTTDTPQLARLQLRLTEQPTDVPSAHGKSVNQSMPAEVTAVLTRGGWEPATGQIEVEVEHADARLRVNQTVRVLGLLGRPLPAANPGQFDFAAFDRGRRILASLVVPRGNTAEIVDDPGPTPLEEERDDVRQWLTRGFSTQQQTDLALLRSMLLGDRDPALANLRDDFENAGVAYQLGVGGLHVALLAGCVVLLCRWLCLRPRAQVVIVTGFVLVYAAVAVPTDSGRRAVMLAVTAAAALVLRRRAQRTQLLMLTLWALLVWHPLDLYSPGFLLGAAAVIGLVLLGPRAREVVAGLTDPHVAAAPQPRDRSRLRGLAATVVAGVIRTAEVSVVVWLATLPLLAYSFGLTSAWAVLAGVVVLPVVLVTLVGGLLKIVTTMPVPPSAHLAAVAVDVPVRLLRAIVHAVAGWPGAGLTLAAPTIILIAAYYGLLLLPLLSWRTQTARVVRLAPLLGVGLIFGCGWITRLASASEKPALRVVLLSIGAGQCAVIEPPDGPPWMFDAGSSTLTDPARTVVGPFLKRDHQDHLAGIILSHGDYDHISATAELEDSFGVAPVYISPHFRPNAVDNLPDQQLLATLDDLHDPPRLLSVGDHVSLSKQVGVDVLWPPVTAPLNSNNAGLVLRLNYAGRRVLFPADLQDPGLAGLLQKPDQLSADVLVAAHHGSSESLTPAILQAVHPQLIVASSARQLTKKQRTFDQMATGTRLLRTGDSGALTITITDDGKIGVESFLDHGRVRQ